ncbi:MAG: hypothetical protein IJE01_01690 [Clostridia bacterium]|nr:hypothetical protein [Clostridia bacterium]
MEKLNKIDLLLELYNYVTDNYSDIKPDSMGSTEDFAQMTLVSGRTNRKISIMVKLDDAKEDK